MPEGGGEQAQASQWQEITDFSRGIIQTTGLHWPLGAAEEAGTYRCHTSSSGALKPLPRLHDVFKMGPPTPPTASNLQSEEHRLVGLAVTGPHYGGPDNPTVGVDANMSEIFVCVEAWEENGGDGTDRLHLRVIRYNRHQSNPNWETVWHVTEDIDYNMNVRPRSCSFDLQWSNSEDRGQMGPVVLCWAVSGHARMFPDDTASMTTGHAALPGDKNDKPIPGGFWDPSSLISHQGRIVIFPISIIGWGADAVWVTSEAAYWTKVNDVSERDQELIDQELWRVPIATTRHPSGFGPIVSLGGDELLLVKLQGGAVLIRGDLSDATVEHLPFIQSCGLALNRGVLTNIGFVYPIDGGGVWLYGGGETSEDIAQDMSGGFWRPAQGATTSGTPPNPATHPWGHAATQCAASSDFVFMPDNWIFDLENPGWWKLEAPGEWPAHRWAVDMRNRYAYSTPSGFLTGNDDVVREYRIDRPADSFSWKSQPIPTASPGDNLSFDSLELLATANPLTGGDDEGGKVTVTISSAEGASQSFEFHVPGTAINRADWFRKRVNVRGTYIQIQIESEAYDSNNGAPVVHAIRWKAQHRRPTKVQGEL